MADAVTKEWKAATETPPPFEPHIVELESVKDSKITNVSVYSGRAEISRLFRFTVNAGQNQINISGLPNVLDKDSLRVEGRGAGTIQDVTVSKMTQPTASTTSPKIKELEREQRLAQQGLYRAQQSLSSLDKYIATLDSHHTASSDLKQVLQDYAANAAEIQTQILELSDKAKELDGDINYEKGKLTGVKRNPNLMLKASIGIFADAQGEVEIGLVYAVKSATWEPKYDIRVDTTTKEKAVKVVYKGAITQDTGEDWNDVPLTLETATPTFDKDVPRLHPWTISVYKPPLQPMYRSRMSGSFASSIAPSPLIQPPMMSAPVTMIPIPPLPEMAVWGTEVSSKGNVNATFSVPGAMSIPSDNAAHSVTIVSLVLDAKMSWVCVPKKDTKTHLSAKIKNSSDYLLLSGPASVYVDGSFISRSNVPSVSPEESFDCPLGLDPSLRVTYHPRIKNLSHTGMLTRSDVYLFTQRITLHNTKNMTLENVKVLDQVPVSEDSTVVVKLISPALQLPSVTYGSIKGGKTSSVGTVKIPPPLRVANGIVAEWDLGGEDPDDVDASSVGKDGKLSFVCALPAQGKTNLTLQWEVTAPAKTNITGL